MTTTNATAEKLGQEHVSVSMRDQAPVSEPTQMSVPQPAQAPVQEPAPMQMLAQSQAAVSDQAQVSVRALPLDHMQESADRARGLSVVLSACAEVLLNEPTQRVLDDARLVANALGDTRFDAFKPSRSLSQRYYDRLFVAASPVFVPLMESCIRGSRFEEGSWHFGTIGSAQTDHALRCYRAVGFDFQRLQGFDLAVSSLRPDSLAAEWAFLAFLLQSQAEAPTEEGAQHVAHLAQQFCSEHVALWTKTAADCLLASDDDLYARVCAFAAEAVEELN